MNLPRKRLPSSFHTLFNLFMAGVVAFSFLLQAGGASAGPQRDDPAPDGITSTSDVPGWLDLVTAPEGLYSEYELEILAGRLILFGAVTASNCPNGGLLGNGVASPCGVQAALPEVIQWQNQFNAAIIAASQQSGVPPVLLKNVFAWESQFWPTTIFVNTSEYGLGHLTEMGADSALRWNYAFYKSICRDSFTAENCEKYYVDQTEAIQSALRGVVLQRVNADCSNCEFGLDLKKAESSIPVFATTMLANSRVVKLYIERFTGSKASEVVSEEDLWKFTLSSYNAGPGCFKSALARTYYAKQSITWENLSSNLGPGCRGANAYVDFVSSNAQYHPDRAPVIQPTPAATESTLETVTDAPTASATPETTATPEGIISPTIEPTETSSASPTAPVEATVTPEPPAGETATPTDELPTATPAATVIEAPTDELPTATPEATATETSTPEPPTATPTATETITGLPTDVPPSDTGSDELVVKFKDFPASLFSSLVLNSVGATVEQTVESLGAVVVSVPDGQASAVLDQLNNNLLVDYAEPNYAVQVFYTPNDPGFAQQSDAFLAMQVPEAWDITQGSGALVAVIDTGVDTIHPDLDGALWTNPGETGLDASGNDKRTNGIDDDNDGYVDDWQGWNFTAGTNNPGDDNGHGTHIAGIIAGRMDNNEGIAGIAPQALVMPLKALDAGGHGTYASVAEAIFYAVDHGAQIINLGFGGTDSSQALLDATNYAFDHGVLVIAAGGNSGTGAAYYPAANPNVIAVSALDGNLDPAPFSSFNDNISLSAPGVNTYSALPGNQYGPLSGTSMSAAEVSGVAALLAGLPKFDTAAAIREALVGAASDLGEPGWDANYGYGLVHALDALSYAPGQMPTPTASPTPDGTITPTATPGDGGGVDSMAVQDLWGTTLSGVNGGQCAGGSNANGVDSAFDGDFATCTVDNNNQNIVYTAITDTTYNPPTLVYLTLGWFTSGWADDTLSLQVSPNNGGTWTTIAIFNSATPPPSGSAVYQIYNVYGAPASLNTQARVNNARVRIQQASVGGDDNINIYLDEVRLGVYNSPNAAPSINITAPSNNSTFAPGTNVTFTGTATDPDSGNLSSSMMWSSDQDGYLGRGASLTLNTLSIGTHIITASVTDSGGLTATQSILIYVIDPLVNVPPVLTILSPANGESFQQGTTVGFIGSASNSIGGDISRSIIWRDGATTIGTGSSFGISTFGLGAHTITARVTDTNTGLTTTASITINITAIPAPGVSPHGMFNASTDTCAGCHRTHSAQSWGPLVTYPDSPYENNNFCMSCHGSGSNAISTHSNQDSVAIEQPFELLCIQCHDPHGNSPNLSAIRKNAVLGSLPATYNNMTASASEMIFTSTAGTGSFDDGTSPAGSRLCVVCHQDAANPGAPMSIHTGGAGHSGGISYTGQDCTSCHPHSLDTDPATRDGFTTSCRACHSQPQDAGQGTPRRQIVGYPNGAGGNNNDFMRASHHVSGNDTATEADCKTCHELSLHRQGKVRLYNQDNSATVYTLDYRVNAADDPADYEAFCLSCHDANGQNGNTTPFSDKILIPQIDTSLWSASQHNIIKLTFSASCLDCHSNGHGSNKTYMQSRYSSVAPWDWQFTGSGTAPADVMDQEEDFCFKCHQTGSTTGTPVQAAFTNYTNTATRLFKHDVSNTYTRHDPNEVFASLFGGTNRHIECGDCHGPHADKAGAALAPTVKPENIGASGVEPVYSGTGAPSRFTFMNLATNEYQFCFKCHSSYATLPAYRPDGWTGGAYSTDGLRKLEKTTNGQQPDWRDLAREFNPNAASFHPVEAAGKNTTWPANTWATGVDVAGSTMCGGTPCSATSRLFCTDCHANATPATGAIGPHGSPRLHILKGTADYITDDSGNDITHDQNELCFQCHSYATYNNGTNDSRFTDHERHKFASCYDCHDSHGSETPHLINFNADHITFNNGKNSITAYTHEVNGNNTGSCDVACHGHNHNDTNYP